MPWHPEDKPKRPRAEPFAEHIAGADGCRAGWLCIAQDVDGGALRSTVYSTASALLDQAPAPVMMTVGVPIGLAEHGERDCDKLARGLLGRRACCIVTAPTREMLLAASRDGIEALHRRADGKLAASPAWSNFEFRVRDIDRVLRPEHQLRVREVHPELCFRELNAGEPLMHGKKVRAGRDHRKVLLEREFGVGAFDSVRRAHRATDVADSDILDVLAALFTARRIHGGHAGVIPEQPVRDAAGLRMEMWM